MIRIPAPFSFSIYRGATFSSLMTFFEKDPDKEPLDLTLFDDIEIRFFRRSNQDDPDYIRSVSDSTLQIGGGDDNELTFSFTPEEAKGLHDLRVVYSELRFFINGDIFVYQNGQARLVNVPQGAGANDFELTITKETNEITIEGLASVARAIQANEDADEIKQAIEQLVEDAENAKEAAENSASDAEKHAQETGPFEDSQGNQFDKGAKGYSEDASGSATASGESAELSEKWATEDEDTPVETDPDRFSAFHWAQKALAAAASILGLNQIRDTPEITELEDDTAIPVQRDGEDSEHINRVNLYLDGAVWLNNIVQATSDYIKRVLGDGGEVIDKQKTDFNYRELGAKNSQAFFDANGGFELVDNNGRKEIAKAHDLSDNENDIVTSAGERAELLTFPKNSISVEKASTRLNLDTIAEDSFTVANEPHALSFEGLGSVTLSGAHSETVQGKFGRRTEYQFTPDAGTLTITPDGHVSKWQVEQSQFATAYIHGSGRDVTRHSAIPILTNALKDNSLTIYHCFSFISPGGAARSFWFTGTNTSTNRSFFQIRATNDFRLTVFGDNGGSLITNTFSFDDWKRYTIAVKLSYNDEELSADILFDGTIHRHKADHDINDTTFKDINFNIAAPQSERYEKLFGSIKSYTGNISNESVAEFFQKITKGTSIEARADDLSIIEY